MTDQHPITPPPELVQQLQAAATAGRITTAYQAAATIGAITTAYQAGADQELEACCEWIYKLMDRGLEWSMDLRTARRPKPPNLKWEALALVEQYEDGWRPSPKDWDTIRRALDSLPD